MLSLADLKPLTFALKHRHGIGIVGAGAIVRSAHLPAYQKHGFPVAGIFDVDGDRSSSAAAEFGLPRAYTGLEEMLADSTVDVVDIAVPPSYQPAIARRAIAAGKHLLCQKPLALSIAEAESLIAEAKHAGSKLAVNVNMRWEPAIRLARHVIKEGHLGDLQSAVFELKYKEEWSFWPWLVNSPRLLILIDMIHTLDITREIFGEPSSVTSSYGLTPQQEVKGETWAKIRLLYPGGATVLIDEDSTVVPEKTIARFTFKGSEATLIGTLGIYYDYPIGRPDTLKFVPEGAHPESVPAVTLTERWIPDAFAGTMGELLRAIEEDSTPQNNGEDHLGTLRLVDRIYREGAPGEVAV